MSGDNGVKSNDNVGESSEKFKTPSTKPRNQLCANSDIIEDYKVFLIDLM